MFSKLHLQYLIKIESNSFNILFHIFIQWGESYYIWRDSVGEWRRGGKLYNMTRNKINFTCKIIKIRGLSNAFHFLRYPAYQKKRNRFVGNYGKAISYSIEHHFIKPFSSQHGKYT